MASPLTTKVKWPSQGKSKAGMDMSAFVPYLSNLVNTFRKTPRPIAPAQVDYVPGSQISLDAARAETNTATRMADLATSGLDAQTAGAIKVGNLGTRLRSLNEIAGKEAMINAQSRMQTNSINANINAQNTGIINQYHDDITNSQIAQQREQSENLSNAADKFIGQQAMADQIRLDRDKTVIMSKAYDQGVYDRLGKRLQTDGITIPGTSTPSAFDKYRKMRLKDYASGGRLTPTEEFSKMKKFIALKNSFAAGGMLSVLGESGDPEKPALMRGIQGTDKGVTSSSAFHDNQFAMEYPNQRTAYGIDMVNSTIEAGVLPSQMENDITMRKVLDPKMYKYMYMFNQRPDLKGMTPDQRRDAFYNIPSSDADVQAMKDQMKTYGYGPKEFRRTQSLTMATKKKFGGKLIKPFA